ncbi:NAD-glutamate dehydrogenase [Mycolicibacterium thermoresistibile]
MTRPTDAAGATGSTVFSADILATMADAYVESHRGPQVADPDHTQVDTPAADRRLTIELVDAHQRLARRRAPGESRVAVYPADDPAGFGPALQIVTDHTALLMDSVTVLLHRLGVAYSSIMNPVFGVRRGPDGDLIGLPAVSGDSADDAVAEAWIHVQLSRSADRRAVAEAAELLPGVLADSGRVARDYTALAGAFSDLAARLETAGPERFPGAERADVAKLLRWLGDGRFLLLGYQQCPIRDGQASVHESSRLGVLRSREGVLPPLTRPGELLVLAQSTIPSYLRYGTYPFIVVIREHTDGSDGHALEHRFVGMFTVAAMNANVFEIPLISSRVTEAMELSQRAPGHRGQLLHDVIQTIPRPELFTLSAEQLLERAKAVIELGSRRRALLFLRADHLAHFASCLVYLPRDRYTTAVRLQMQEILVRELGGVSIDYTARVSESPWAVVHFIVRLPDGAGSRGVDVSAANEARIAELLTEAARTWGDRLLGAAQQGYLSHAQAEHYAEAFSDLYKQAVDPTDAIDDIAIIEELGENSVRLVLGDRSPDRVAPLTWYVAGKSASLSRLLPMLQSMGVVVLEERPFAVSRADDLPLWIYQFKIALDPALPDQLDDAGRQRFADAVTAVWHGRAETDRFNELVLRAGLTWPQVAVLRAYAKYLRQAAFPYSQDHIATVLNEHPGTARALVQLFEALFDPSEDRRGDAQAAASAVAADIDAVVSLDTDRVLRAFASLVEATVRTNFFVARADSAREQGVLSVKLRPTLIEELPLPRPMFEIFVYSPRVEGVHLRFGHVARGGLRWSTRREDFRTEILGLVKAQAVKNAVIVPVGAKGGFVVKRPPDSTGDDAADREAARAEGVACYRLFISGLLDITDNVDKATGEIVAPHDVVRRDGDDAYLVVAADKGTATFSDIANEVAESYDFWLGDAFASGGSVGYDHKAMGITARGAWESVKRHFREMGVDTQTQDFTVAGIGDMSGDVFGNGMLLSRHIRLVAAFDHRHIFLDPDPDAERSWEERKRLFDLPRSSWEDYDTSLLSKGGGVHSRDQKSIAITDEVRVALGLDDGVETLTPPALVRAVLRAPVDLLWNGGIGTYVKAETESHADVGDRANDPVRVNGNQVGAKVIGEGGNLGVTPRGRIEFDLAGGRINTDALDNSAGVDCSDHEVNIKILVDSLVTAGKIEPGERVDLLMSMTDEVGRMVLDDNASQNDLMGTSRTNAAGVLPVHARQITDLVENHGLNRELEALPSDKEIARRDDAGIGLTSPELATLMAHIKLTLKDAVLASDLPDQEVFAARLPMYFPERLREFGDEIRGHQLRREIVTTMLVNDLVDTAGLTYAFRVSEDAGVGPIDAVRSFVAVNSIFRVGDVWRAIRAASAENELSVAVSDRMTLDLRRLIDRAGRWLLNYRPQPLAVGAEINRFGAKVADLTPRMSEWLRGADAEIVARRTAEFADHGASEELGYQVAGALYQFSLLDIIDIADILDREPAEVAETYFALMNHLGTDALLAAVSELPRSDRWHSLARLAVRDDIYGSLRLLTIDVLAVGEPEESGEEKIAEWESTNSSRLQRARRTLDEIYQDDNRDLATLSVAARQIRAMTRTSGTGSSG